MSLMTLPPRDMKSEETVSEFSTMTAMTETQKTATDDQATAKESPGTAESEALLLPQTCEKLFEETVRLPTSIRDIETTTTPFQETAETQTDL